MMSIDALEDGHNGSFVDAEALFQFLLQRSELAGQFAAVGQ
jgi:hypothetical protein